MVDAGGTGLIFPGMPHSISDGAIRGHTIGHAIANGEFDPVHSAHVGAQENAVTIVDQCQD